MRYFVTHGCGAVAIDAEFDLEQALNHACQMLSEGRLDVGIQDSSGRSIRGKELELCCRGERTLTADLRAVSD